MAAFGIRKSVCYCKGRRGPGASFQPCASCDYNMVIAAYMHFRSYVLLAALAIPSAFCLDPSLSLTQYVHRIQQVSPQGTIFSIWQSHDGYLWLATQRGLMRFDGVRFTSPENNNGVSLENTWVRSLL